MKPFIIQLLIWQSIIVALALAWAAFSPFNPLFRNRRTLKAITIFTVVLILIVLSAFQFLVSLEMYVRAVFGIPVAGVEAIFVGSFFIETFIGRYSDKLISVDSLIMADRRHADSADSQTRTFWKRLLLQELLKNSSEAMLPAQYLCAQLAWNAGKLESVSDELQRNGHILAQHKYDVPNKIFGSPKGHLLGDELRPREGIGVKLLALSATSEGASWMKSQLPNAESSIVINNSLFNNSAVGSGSTANHNGDTRESRQVVQFLSDDEVRVRMLEYLDEMRRKNPSFSSECLS
jgi:hypothetical protein